MEVKQELLPGLPDDITLSNVAPKLKWETCNVLQLVSRGWQHAIFSRSVYDSKVRSNTTEPFLLLLSLHRQYKIVVNLLSCKDGSSRQLPPFSVPYAVHIHCICLAGRVFVWVTTRNFVMGNNLEKVCWTLDLVGDRQWAQQKLVEDSCEMYACFYGLVGGNIYRCPRSSEFLEQRMRRGCTVPQLEVYDTRRDVWSFMTPNPAPKWADPLWSTYLENPLAIPLYKAEKPQVADPSKTLLIDGLYVSELSEWRGRQSVSFVTTSTTDNNCVNPMAAQIFYFRTASGRTVQDEHFFCSGAKLFKLIKKKYDVDNGRAKIQVYDTQKNKWEQWRLFSEKFEPMDKAGCSWRESECVSADNAVWATVTKLGSGGRTTSLMRSPACLSEESAESLTWIDTGYSLKQPVAHKMKPGRHPFADCIVLRPIYV